ncbi:MAG: Alpha-agarase [Arcobacter lacus]|jgi:adhesin transport system outer membrane protein|nr:MAG: Alpha-agarase [Arcobacter lacus]
MGRRTLLDLLSAQNDILSSKNQIINAQMDKLYAQYRILDAMGVLVKAVVEDTDVFNKIASPTINPFDIVEDTLPVNLDVDADKIIDANDICDNSENGNNDITPYGCSQEKKDSDIDGIIDAKDECPNTTFGATVGANGCEVNDSKNKFFKEQNSFINSVPAYTEESPIKSEKLGLYDYQFDFNPNRNIKSTSLDNHLMYDQFELIKRFDFINMDDFNPKNNNLSEIIDVINSYKDEDIKVTVIGHTEGNENKEESFNKAASYAETIKEQLINNNISENIIIDKSRVDYDKAFLETNRNDDTLNNIVAEMGV